MEQAKKERPKFKRFPTLKRAKGQRGNADIDIAKLKELYLAGTHYAWVSFCEVHHFNPESRNCPWFKEKLNWEEWKREWVKKRTLLTDEEITPLMLDSTKLVAHGRIKFVQDWSSIAKNMKALLVHLMNEHVANAAADQRNDFASQVVGMKKLKLTIDELSEFAAAGNRIAELEARAFLIVAGDRNSARRALEDDGDGKGSAASEDPSEFDVVPMGTIMNADERTRTIAAYFDQFQQPAEPAAPALAAPVEEPDAED